MGKLSRSLTSCDQGAADETLQRQLTELSVQACSLLLCQISSNLRGLIDLLCTGMGQNDLIPVSYANNKSALLVSPH